MVNRALQKDTQAIYALWKDIFKDDDFGFTDYFFKYIYKPESTLVIKDNEKIVSIGSRFIHTYMLNGRLVQGSMIVGMATIKEYRNKGNMHQIMNTFLDIVEHQELVTLIQAYDPKIYEQFGFEMVYKRKLFKLNNNNFKVISTSGATTDNRLRDLVVIYAKFTQKFNGYMVRDENYYDLYIKELMATNGQIVSIYENGEIKGYGVFKEIDNKIVIAECIYLDLRTLYKIISVALKLKNNVELKVSSYEYLEKVLNIEGEIYDYTMARINDYRLFNRLYSCNVQSPKEGFLLGNKPLFLKESY